MARTHTAKTGKGSGKKDVKTQKYNPKSEPVPRKNIGAVEDQETTKASTKGKDKLNEAFKQEIFALGGDNDDVDLLKDVGSDISLTENAGTADVKLSKDVANLIKELGLNSLKHDSASEEDATSISGDDPEEDESQTSEDAEPVERDPKTPSSVEKQVEAHIKEMNVSSKTLIEPSPTWHTILASLQHPPSDILAPASPKYNALLQKAQSLHEKDCETYNSSSHPSRLTASSSDAAFLQRVLTSGTLSDRLSALTLMVQSSPLHNVKALETLRTMSGKKGRDESLKALRAIVDWWIGGGAPDRKLKHFVDQPLGHKGVTDRHLVLWYFEDWLKKYFYSLLQALERLSLDPLPYVRLQSMNLIFNLLRGKPEQEHNLLRLLVNKLGDSEKSVASRASYQLLQLLQAHPQMKGVVIREITSLILRPTVASAPAQSNQHPSGRTHLKFTDEASTSAPKAKPPATTQKKSTQRDHAKYYAAITCNQILLAPADRDVARQLVKVYFEIFKEILKSDSGGPIGKGKGKGKAVVEDPDSGDDRTVKGRGKGKKSGEKIHQGDAGFAEVEDSTSRLISAVLTGVNRALPFAKMGLDDVEFSGYIDTLFLITHTSTFNVSLQALRLLLQISSTLSTASTATSPAPSSSKTAASSISDRYYRALYASLLDSRLNSTNKRAMYLNLLFKSLKEDKDPRKSGRTKAFVKRFLQLLIGAGDGNAEFVAGGLYLLGELFSVEADLRGLLGPELAASQEKQYDPKTRDPQYANAGSSSAWELVPLLSHYHPSISLHASQLLTSRPITGSADLSLNTLSHFLDRFINKNPKKAKPKGASAMQPGVSGGIDGSEVRLVKGSTGQAIVDKSIAEKKVGDVPVDQVFFHKYYSTKEEKSKAKAEKAKKRRGAEDASDENEDDNEDDEDDVPEVGEGTDSEEEAEIWAAMKATNPDMKGVADEDEDDEISLSSDEHSEADNSSTGSDNLGDDLDDDDDLSLAERSDAEELIDFDGDSEDASDNEEEWGGIGGDTKKRLRRQSGEDEKRKRKKLKSLPTFASYEDYAKMIEDEPEDNI